MRFKLFKYSVLLFLTFSSAVSYGQEEVSTIVNEILEDQQSGLTSKLNGEELLADLLLVYQNPIELNSATKEQLEQLSFLSDYQIENLLFYLYTSGSMLSLYELKAVPGFDSKAIQWLLPFVRLGALEATDQRNFINTEILARYTRILEDQKGFTIDSGNHYLGDANAVLLRVDGTASKGFSWHLLSQKDKGEQSYYDFLSGGVAYKGRGWLKQVVVGDYKIRAGQGLLSWSGNSFGKSMEVDQVRRKGEVLSLYRSALESGFYRGGAAQFQLKNLTLTTWGSKIAIDAKSDSIEDDWVIETIAEDGLHNTPSKLAGKHAAHLSSFGGNLRWNNKWFRPGFTYLYQPLDIPLIKISDESFVLYPTLDSWHNYSFDFFTSIKHMHLWGEVAMQSHGSYATIAGANLFPHDAFQATLIYRNYSSDFFSVYGSAFGESGNPNNETGLFLGAKLIPSAKISINASLDIYAFPWLRYQQTFLSSGYEVYVKSNYDFNRYSIMYFQFRYENKERTSHFEEEPMDQILEEERWNLRLNFDNTLTDGIRLTSRVELCLHQLQSFSRGVLVLQDVSYKTDFPLSGNIRFAWFKTDSYSARIYAYEKDVLYAFSVPAYYGNGIRTYLNLNYQAGRKLSFWLKFSRVSFFDREEVGTGLNTIKDDKRTDIKLQVRVKF